MDGRPLAGMPVHARKRANGAMLEEQYDEIVTFRP
jgi:hypothetical protein